MLLTDVTQDKSYFKRGPLFEKWDCEETDDGMRGKVGGRDSMNLIKYPQTFIRIDVLY